MRHSGGVVDKRFYPTEAFRQRENIKLRPDISEVFYGGDFYFEGDHATWQTHLLLG